MTGRPAAFPGRLILATLLAGSVLAYMYSPVHASRTYVLGNFTVAFADSCGMTPEELHANNESACVAWTYKLSGYSQLWIVRNLSLFQIWGACNHEMYHLRSGASAQADHDFLAAHGAPQDPVCDQLMLRLIGIP